MVNNTCSWQSAWDGSPAAVSGAAEAGARAEAPQGEGACCGAGPDGRQLVLCSADSRCPAAGQAGGQDRGRPRPRGLRRRSLSGGRGKKKKKKGTRQSH